MKALTDKAAEYEARTGHRSYGGEWSYQDFIESMEVDVVLERDAGSYQGDTYVIVREGPRWGYLEFGWGSCSGCDAAQSIGSLPEATEFRDGMYQSIHWEPTQDEFATWMRERDWVGQYSWHYPELREFLGEAWALLGIEGEPPKDPDD